jgi:hypothetical protein
MRSADPLLDDMSLDPKSVALRLLEYCRANDWSGYDPYDALNSPLLKALPIVDSRFPRIALTQLLKRSPLNVRPLLGIPKTQNPKALALFLTSFLKMSRIGLLDGNGLSKQIIERLVALRSPETKYWCWGYSFPWQTRTIVVPCFAPSLVCTTFVAGALLNVYDQSQEARLLEMAVSAGQYILDKLYYSEGDNVASFSYPLPDLGTKVHNANFLAAALLCRLFHHTGDEKFLAPALRATRYSTSKQRSDGSWPYGELPTQQWIDNFHTGYNLSALRSIGRDAKTTEFDDSITTGFEFYRNHFIREDGAARYFHNQTYPIDVHCVAQTLLTLIDFQDLNSTNPDVIRSVYTWAMKHMWDERGFFYYRVLRTVTIRTSYMRWSQAWMLLALTVLAEQRERVAQTVDHPQDLVSASV